MRAKIVIGMCRGDSIRPSDSFPVIKPSRECLTTWREDGANGYLWSLSTPQVRFYAYRKSRGSVVVKELLGTELADGGFAGSLVTDFYAAYNIYDGVKSRFSGGSSGNYLRSCSALRYLRRTTPIHRGDPPCRGSTEDKWRHSLAQRL